MRRRGPFEAGDRVQLTGPRGRLNTITLEAGQAFHTHRVSLPHDDIIGRPDGSVLTAPNGDEFLALRPLLSDFVLSMPRGAAIVYPKDAAQIVGFADVFPGAHVLEAGVGSGALTLSLLRAIGPEGRLTSIERREEFAVIAQANVTAFEGERPANWRIEIGDFAEAAERVAEPASIDRVVLDMLAPWECIEASARVLLPGGVLVCYVATVTQLSRTVETVRASGRFAEPDSFETLLRGWHVEGLAVRPDHRMTGHTGFLMTARLLAPGAVPPALKRRASKSEYDDEDVEAWTPGALGERPKSDKRLRRAARDAQRAADARTAGADDPGAAAATP